jgi:dihydroflavonol-4-reductase
MVVMDVVVTGAAGFLGGVLVRRLRSEGRSVRSVDLRRPPGLPEADWVAVDVLDRSGLVRAFTGARVVFHLAAMISVTGDPTGRVWSVNVDGVANAAEAARRAGVNRFVHCSSIHAFDLGRAVPPIDERAPRSIAPDLPVYDRSKEAGEERLREAVARGLDAVVVNPTAIIGPHDDEPSRMGWFFRSVFAHRLPASVAGGFDWVDVRDVATALLAAERAGAVGASYLVGGHYLTVTELARLAARVAGVRPPPVEVPGWFARVWSPLADRMAVRTRNPLWYTSESLAALGHGMPVDDTLARTVLGHHPRSIEETVADIHRWSRGGAVPFDGPDDQPKRPWAKPSVFEQVGQKNT